MPSATSSFSFLCMFPFSLSQSCRCVTHAYAILLSFFFPLCFYECGKQRFLLIDTSVILACFPLSFALRSSSAMLSEHLLPSSFPLSFSALLFFFFFFLTLVLREAGNGGLGETALSVNTEKCYISYFSLFCFIFLYNNVYLLICFYVICFKSALS